MYVVLLTPGSHRLTRFSQGAWAPLMLAVILMSFMLFWTWAKVLKLSHTCTLHRLISRLATGRPVRRCEQTKPSSLHRLG